MNGKELIKELNSSKEQKFKTCKDAWKNWKKRKKLLKKTLMILTETAGEFESSGRYIGKARFYRSEHGIIVEIKSSFYSFSKQHDVRRKLRIMAFILDTNNLCFDIMINGDMVEKEIPAKDLENGNLVKFLKMLFNQTEFTERW